MTQRAGALVPRLAAAVLAFAALRCAHVEAPSGGPIDTVRPAVAAVYPAPGSLNVPVNAPVVFQFTEWIDRNASRNQAFISPPFRGKLRVEADGDKLQVRPPASSQGFKPNTAYQVTLLRTLPDLHGIALGRPFSLRFSTGPSIDVASLSGRLISDAGAGAPLIALYRATGRDVPGNVEALSARDTAFRPAAVPEPWRELPALLAPADSLGVFHLDSVAQGDYAVFAFNDLNGNFAFDLGFESAALGPLSVAMRPNGPDQTLSIAPVDTLPLRVLKAEFRADSVDSIHARGLVRLEFSRAPNPVPAAQAERYRLLGDSGEVVPVRAAGWSGPAGGWVLEVPALPIKPARNYRVEVRGRPDFIGRNGTSQIDTSLSFAVDTARAGAPWTLSFAQATADGLAVATASLPAANEYRVLSNKALSPERRALLERQVQLRVDTLPTAFTVTRFGAADFTLRLSAAPRPGSRIDLRLPILAAPGDTLPPPAPTQLAELQILDSTNSGGIRFKPPARWAQWTFVLEGPGADSTGRVLSAPGANGSVEAKELPLGIYRLTAFKDDDRDGFWNAGALKPWIPQELRARALDTVVVAPGLVTELTDRFAP